MLFDAIISRPAGGLVPGRVCHALHVYYVESATAIWLPSWQRSEEWATC